MKIVRYLSPRGEVGYGVLWDDGSIWRIDGDLFGEYRVTTTRVEAHRWFAPVLPAAILCIGLNYREHARETGAALPEVPVLFLKNPAALLHPGDSILLPTGLPSRKVDYEGELAVVIGKRCKNVKRDRATEYVLGYTCANDVSARDWQYERSGGQWCRGKSFDTFAPLGPYLVTAEEFPPPLALRIRTEVNGETLQDSNTSDMIFDVPTLIEFLSGSMTLLPGTVILTGTPPGVGMAHQPPRWLQTGDIVSVEIEGIGRLTNPVAQESV